LVKNREYYVAQLKRQHSGFTLVLAFLPRDIIIEYRTYRRTSSVYYRTTSSVKALNGLDYLYNWYLTWIHGCFRAFSTVILRLGSTSNIWVTRSLASSVS